MHATYASTRTHGHIPIGSYTIYAAYELPPPPLVTGRYIATGIAPEDVEHPVGRRREAHPGARGGAGAGGRQRRPGVGRRAEAVQVVVEVACVCVCVCVRVCVCVCVRVCVCTYMYIYIYIRILIYIRLCISVYIRICIYIRIFMSCIWPIPKCNDTGAHVCRHV
jgi:hypothetical protein